MKTPHLRDRPVEVTMPAHGVSVLQSVHSPDFAPATMRHDFLKLIYVVQGAGRLMLGKVASVIGEGDLLTIPIGQTHRIEDRAREPLTLLVLCLTAEAMGLSTTMLAGLATGRAKPAGAAAERIRTAFRRLLYEQQAQPIGFQMAQRATAQTLLIQLLRAAIRPRPGSRKQPSTTPDAMTRFIAHLDARFFEPLSIDDAAAHLGVSRRHFTQRFRDRTGSTLNRYVRQRRVHHAQHLLSNTPHTVTTICFECGYDNLSTFYRAFHRETRQNPGQWRQTHGLT